SFFRIRATNEDGEVGETERTERGRRIGACFPTPSSPSSPSAPSSQNASHLVKPHPSRLAAVRRVVDLEVAEQRGRLALEHTEAGHRHAADLELGALAQAELE